MLYFVVRGPFLSFPFMMKREEMEIAQPIHRMIYKKFSGLNIGRPNYKQVLIKISFTTKPQKIMKSRYSFIQNFQIHKKQS